MGHRGLLAIGFVGINAFAGESGKNIGPGFRLGGLLGFFASPMFSLNGELSLDVMNLDSNTFGANTTGVRASLSIAPLVHLPMSPTMEVVLGPKLGVWDEELDYSDTNQTVSGSGYLLGLNAGLFTRLGNNTYLGGLFSFENASVNKVCQNLNDGSGDQCVSGSALGNPPSEKVLAFNLAGMF
jgi:hypothetical protein